jgi:type IV secretory pathway ATPase VirB11/archaellum biosynthesis ATPase
VSGDRNKVDRIAHRVSSMNGQQLPNGQPHDRYTLYSILCVSVAYKPSRHSINDNRNIELPQSFDEPINQAISRVDGQANLNGFAWHAHRQPEDHQQDLHQGYALAQYYLYAFYSLCPERNC